MRRDPVSLVWIAGIALAVLFYLLDPGWVAQWATDALARGALWLDLMFAQLTFVASDVVRAVALAAFAVFWVLTLLTIRRGGKGRMALVLVTLVFVALVGGEGGGPEERRWGEALLLSAVAALTMTRRLRLVGLPARR